MKIGFKKWQIEINWELNLSYLWRRPLVIVLLAAIILYNLGLPFYLFDNKSAPRDKGIVSNTLAPQEALATYQFVPTGGGIVTGTAVAITSQQAISTTVDLNVGSWKGTLADDNVHWMINSTASGLNTYLDVGRVQLSGANTLIITTEIDEDATSPALLFQICDWTSSSNVDAAADTQCTGGGWRTLNNRKTTVAPTTYTAYGWYVYDGLWASGNTPVSTPLTNFVDGANKIRIRYFSTTNTTTPLGIDYLRVFAVVNPVYAPAGFTNLGTGPVTNFYTNVNTVTQGASDNNYLTVAGTASSVADFYLPFKNVKTYTGMNTILVRAEYSCSTTGNTHRPKIYNFTTSLWEDLSPSSITCSATDATNIFAKNNVTLSDYISSGEIRVGWRTLSNGTQAIRLDQIYITLGTTNTSTANCEIPFGTVSAGDCSNTRTIDTTQTISSWNILAEDESTAMGHDYYPYNTDMDATTLEEARSGLVPFSVTAPSNSAVTGVFFAGRFLAGTAGTVQLGVQDFSGNDQATGGWTAVGATATTALVYTDNLTVTGNASGGLVGMNLNPEDYVDTVNNTMSLRLRTTVDGASTNNSVAQWDFALVSLQWVETGAGGILNADIVDGSGNSVASPSVSMAASSLGFDCQTASGSFGTSSEKVRVNNTTSNPNWTLTIAAALATDLWSAGTPKFDFNDSGGAPAGCGDGGDTDGYAGQMTLDPSGATITAQGGCNTTGLSLGSSTAFVEGTTNNITLVTASSAQTNCYWDITGVGISQKIPAEQAIGTYAINLTVTVTAN